MRDIPAKYEKLYLTKGKFALVDKEDYERVNKHKWFAVKNRNYWYAIRTIYYPDGSRYRQLMHRFIMGFINKGEGQPIDHRNRKGLDNRKANLRLIKGAENQQNMRKHKQHSSVYKGVSWSKNAHKWISQVTYKKKNYYLGYFDNEIKAAVAYDRKAYELFGDFACLNFKKVRPLLNMVVQD